MKPFLFCEMWINFLCPWKRIICCHKNEELSTPFPDTASGCRIESLSTLTSCQRSKNLGMNLPPGLPCRFPQSPGSCGNSFNMVEGSEVLKVPCPVTIILNFYVLDKETNQKLQVHKQKNQRRMKMLVPRNRVKKLDGITEIWIFFLRLREHERGCFVAIRGKAKASVIKLFSLPWNSQIFVRYWRQCGFLARETRKARFSLCDTWS